MTLRTAASLLHRPISDTLRFLPEGPYPLGESRISWVAIQHGGNATQGSLNILDLSSGDNQNFELPGRPGFAFPCDDGHSFVAGCERTLGIFDTSDSSWTPFCEGIDDGVDNTIINDGLAFEDNLIFGCKDLEFATKKAGLYLWRGRDKTLVKLRDDQICSNGKAVTSADGKLFLYDIDSPTKQVVRYEVDIESGSLSTPEVVLDLTQEVGVPDGAILTPDGSGMIISVYNPDPAPAGETRLYDLASGECKQVWETAASPQNTCPNLVRHNGKIQLVITTAVEHMSAQRQAEAAAAGSLFITETDFSDIGSCPRFPLAAVK